MNIPTLTLPCIVGENGFLPAEALDPGEPVCFLGEKEAGL